MHKIISNYRDSDNLRNSFNELAKKTFGLDFEDWYQNGFWTEKYNPYSIIIDDKIVANVSVNITNMMWKGRILNLLQLGTVMTDESYRNQGLIREIMEAIEIDYKDKTDGMYLFASDSVVDFYPKFGFAAANQYQFSKAAAFSCPDRMVQIPMNCEADWEIIQKKMKTNCQTSDFKMVDNVELYMFYLTKFMQQNVFYDKETEAYVIAELEEGNLFVHEIFSEEGVPMEDVIQAFGSEIKRVTLGFTPKEKDGFVCNLLEEEDCTLFVKGEIFGDLRKEQLMFPTLAHA